MDASGRQGSSIRKMATVIEFRSDGRPGRRPVGAQVAASLLLSLVVVGSALPTGAGAHGGEVHAEEPETAAIERSEGPSGEGVTQSGASPGKGRGQGNGPEMGQASARNSELSSRTEVSSAREETASGPAIHFLALGVVAVAGAGLLLVRRHRFAG